MMTENTINNEAQTPAEDLKPKTTLDILKDAILPNLPEGLATDIDEAFGQLVLHVEQKSLVKLINFLRDDANCRFQQLIDVCGVDYPIREKRFEIIYQLLSLKHNKRITVKLHAGEDDFINSLAEIFPNAIWLEREVYDMYGVRFNNHPDLRRILTDYGFDGYPQRKDFPLTGYKELRYDDTQKRVVYEPVKLAQDYRNFDYLSPWEGGVEYVLPGDEKAK